jgi:hypothetical protein
MGSMPSKAAASSRARSRHKCAKVYSTVGRVRPASISENDRLTIASVLASREAHRRSDMLTRRRVTYASVVELYSAVRRLKPLRFPRASGSGLARALRSKRTRLRGRDCFGGLLPREEDAGMTAVRKFRPLVGGSRTANFDPKPIPMITSCRWSGSRLWAECGSAAAVVDWGPLRAQ